MIKNNAKVYKYIILLLAILGFIALSVFGNFSYVSSAEGFNDYQSSGTLGNSATVKIYNRKNNLINNLEEVSYQNSVAYKSSWKDSKSFAISYIQDPEHLPKGNPTSEEGVLEYTLSIEIQYKQVYLNDTWEGGEKVILTDVIRETRNSLSEIEKIVFEFDIDSGYYKEGQETNKIGQWGIYQFTVTVNNLDSTSAYYFIEPESDFSTEKLEVTYDKIISPNSMHYSYDFSLKDSENYKYMNQNLFKWYVIGKAKDGTYYALLKEDLENPTFSLCTKYLYDSLSDWDRSGLDFYFNDNNIAGEWFVWVEYNYSSSDGHFISAMSEPEKIITGSDINNMVIVYIIIAIAVVSIATTFGIVLYKKKREKVW